MMSIKSIIQYFIVILLYLFSSYLIFNRYVGWGIEASRIVVFLILFLVSITLVFMSFKMTKDLFNPYAAYSLFVFFLGYSYIPINSKQILLDNYALFLLLLSVGFFILGMLLTIRIRLPLITIKISNYARKKILIVLFAISIIVYLLEIKRFGYIPIFKIFSMDVYKDTMSKSIPILHYFVLLSSIMPAWAFLLFKQNIIKKKLFLWILFISLFMIINFLSRQFLLLIFLTYLFVYLFYNKITLSKVLLLSALPVLIFMLFGALRLVSIVNDDRTQKEFLKDYAGSNPEANILEIYAALYSSNNFSTFQDFVNRSEKENYVSYGVYTFKPLTTITLINRLGGAEINPDFDSEKSLATYAIEPYLDFRLFGIILCNLFYGFLLGYFYKIYKRKNLYAIIPYTVLFYCTLMSPFTNFFNMFFIWMILFLNAALIPTTSNTSEVCVSN